MKNRKALSIVLTVLLLAAILTGCGAKASNDRAPMEDYYFNSESAAGAFDGAGEKVEADMSSSSGAALADRKLIKTVELTAETEDLDALLTAITGRVSELGGYIENQRVYNGSAYASYRSRSASLTIRIPADRLDGFVDHVAENTNIVSRYAYIDDVTLTYVATESRVKALQAEESRLLELMDKAENLTDLLQVEARLTDVRYELESVTSRLRTYDNQINYATIHLDISEVQEYTPVEEPSLWQRLSTGFKNSLKDLGESLQDLLVFLVVAFPFLLVYGGIAFVVIWLIRIAVKKRPVGKKVPWKKPEKKSE